jgi:hypothetical protein
MTLAMVVVEVKMMGVITVITNQEDVAVTAVVVHK